MKLAVQTKRTQKDKVNLNAEIAILYDELGIPFQNLEEESPYENLTELNSVIRKSKQQNNLRSSIDSENKENQTISRKPESNFRRLAKEFEEQEELKKILKRLKIFEKKD